MRLTLDWDAEELRDLHLPAVRSRQPARENQRKLAGFADDTEAGAFELWTSSNHGNDGSDGYHYIEYDTGASLEDTRRLRKAYGDDALRVALDGKRLSWGSPFPSVMYHIKNIKPGEHHPYETQNRAELLQRTGFDGETVETKGPDGNLNYPAIIKALADHEDFGSRAALFRRIQQRGSVDVTTDPSKRGYDLVNGRREPTRGEQKALRDYAESRDLGHYGDGSGYGEPEALASKPKRTVFHEYFEMPEIEFDAEDFGDPDADSDSEWYPANIRTGTYGDVAETTVKQAHDRLADRILDMLSPGVEHGGEWLGIDLSRYDYAISLERQRPIDRDEANQYRRNFYESQPSNGNDAERVQSKVSDTVDPFGESAIVWEVIVYDGEDALEASGSTDYWWILRGVLDAEDAHAVRSPLDQSTIIEDTMGFL